MCAFLSKQTLAAGIKRYEIVAPEIAQRRRAGQFVILRVHEEGERIPITIADANPVRGTITLIVQEVGMTTRLMGEKAIGDFLPDVCGPLGEPTHIENFGHCVCLAGGVGVAEIFPVVQALQAGGNRVTAIIGARSKELLILENEIPARLEEVHHAEQEGIEFRFLEAPVAVKGNAKGWVTGIELIKMQLGEPDESGRRRPCRLRIQIMFSISTPLSSRLGKGRIRSSRKRRRV